MKINNVDIIISAVSKKQYPIHDLPEILLLGRSNVGKSSFINTIINRRALARTSSQPGKTRTINFYNVEDIFCFVDMPGYGYAKVSKAARQEFKFMIDEYVHLRDNLLMVIQLIDFRHKPTEDDINVNNWLQELGITPLIVATKIDKVKNNDYRKNIKQIMDSLKIEDAKDLILFSATSKRGKEELMQILDEVLLEEDDI
ncbi:YihA family ribosome biogenesis GTP-binding protein [Alkalibaculum sp. M08DMB]|uniref:Probable GTP-binding protein EngB n=1 Tax=Alkalibaculum sporogenes TaxID=2655001 RepID=A0A6A7K925_9FIRM|nr:ribosome biogenesis GTP-binding protein YihA/YsxC [Alkalibaculum sporogenes]MPW25906.1 YihA family ribosome biogenesis GTP-binding protein [Alkalibaculum sporogenes]